MTDADQLTNIAATVRRIEAAQSKTDDRLDKLERFADRAEGAITLSKFVLSILGIGGITAIVATLSRGGL